MSTCKRQPAAAIAFSIGVVSGVMGCGGKIRNADREHVDGSKGCEKQVSDTPVRHACSHTTHGPFETVVASPTVGEAPFVDRIHVSYLVEMVPSSGGSFVGFTPTRDGEHLLLLDEAERLVVRHANRIQDSHFAGRLDGCETARYGEVYTLEVGLHYAIEFAAGAHSPTLLFFEHLETFGDDAWTEGCLEGED